MKINDYQFLEALKKTPGVEKIVLFGSRARGNPRPHSDIDLAVQMKKPYTNKEWFNILSIVENADTLLHIDCVELTEETAPALRKNIEKEGVVLFQRAL